MAASRMSNQLVLFVAVVLSAAVVVFGVGTLLLPDSSSAQLADTANEESLPTLDDLSGVGAVVMVAGGPVAAGDLEQRYQFQDGIPITQNSVHAIDVTFGFAPESLRLRWNWDGGEPVDVEATINVRGATFYARSGECRVDLDHYEEEERTFSFENPTGEVVEWVEPTASLAGWLTCDDLMGVRLDEPVSMEGVFSVPSLSLVSN